MTTKTKQPARASAYMSDDELRFWENKGRIIMGNFNLVAKHDFPDSGYWDGPTRSHIRAGWIVTGKIESPGAVWAKNLDAARRQVAALSICEALGLSNGDPALAPIFYNLLALSNSEPTAISADPDTGAEILNPDPLAATAGESSAGQTVANAFKTIGKDGPAVCKFWELQATTERAATAQGVRRAFAKLEGAALLDTKIEKIDNLIAALVDQRRAIIAGR